MSDGGDGDGALELEQPICNPKPSRTLPEPSLNPYIYMCVLCFIIIIGLIVIIFLLLLRVLFLFVFVLESN